MNQSINKKFEKSFDQYNDVIYRLCLFKTSNREIAQDLTQEVFTKFYVYVSDKGFPSNIKSFLYQMARNKVIDHYRKHKSGSLEALEESGMDFTEESHGHEQITSSIDLQIAIDTLEKLDEKYRDVMYMRLVEEYGVSEIAEILNISASNVSVRLNRGKKELSKILEQ